MIALYSKDVQVDDDYRVRRQGHVFASVYKAKAHFVRRAVEHYYLANVVDV